MISPSHRPPRGDDDDDFEDDPPPDALPGSVSPAGHDAVGEILLALSGEVLKLNMLLAEASEEEFRAITPRLTLFLNLVALSPTSARPSKKIGFRAPKTKPRRTRPSARKKK